MKKNNKQKHIKARKKHKKGVSQIKWQQPEQTTSQSIVSVVTNVANKGWKIFAGAALIIGLVVSFYPKIEVVSSLPTDPKNIFSAPFIISNKGILPINDVNVLVTMKEIKLVNSATLKAIEDFKPMFELTNSTLPILKGGEDFTISNPFIYHFSTLLKNGAEYADIAIVVRYKPVLLPFSMERFFRFKTSKNIDGNLVWHKQPMNAKTFF